LKLQDKDKNREVIDKEVIANVLKIWACIA